jgi:hypothetical protein
MADGFSSASTVVPQRGSGAARSACGHEPAAERPVPTRPAPPRAAGPGAPRPASSMSGELDGGPDGGTAPSGPRPPKRDLDLLQHRCSARPPDLVTQCTRELERGRARRPRRTRRGRREGRRRAETGDAERAEAPLPLSGSIAAPARAARRCVASETARIPPTSSSSWGNPLPEARRAGAMSSSDGCERVKAVGVPNDPAAGAGAPTPAEPDPRPVRRRTFARRTRRRRRGARRGTTSASRQSPSRRQVLVEEGAALVTGRRGLITRRGASSRSAARQPSLGGGRRAEPRAGSRGWQTAR